MSHEPSHSTEHLPPPAAQADEHVAGFKLVAVGMSALRRGGIVDAGQIDKAVKGRNKSATRITALRARLGSVRCLRLAALLRSPPDSLLPHAHFVR